VALVNSITDTFQKPRLTDRTDRAWLSRLLRYLVRKRSGSILTTPGPTRGHWLGRGFPVVNSLVDFRVESESDAVRVWKAEKRGEICCTVCWRCISSLWIFAIDYKMSFINGEAFNECNFTLMRRFYLRVILKRLPSAKSDTEIFLVIRRSEMIVISVS